MSGFEFARENELLLLTAGGSANDAPIRSIASAHIDWERFFRLAQLERAVPVIYRRLGDLLGDRVPGEVMDRIRRLALVNDFHVLRLESRLRESVRAFNHARVRVMLLKGAGLAYTAYDGIRERPMSDLDVLVDRENAELAHRTMREIGWRDVEGGIPKAVYERHHHLPPLCDEQSRELQLEIHTALFPERQPFNVTLHELWERARPIGVGGARACVPHPVHALLHVCLHFFWSHQARFGVWRTIRDIDALTRPQTLDWQEFVTMARAAKGASCCYWTLRIAQVTAGVAVPTAVLDALRPPRRRYLLELAERHFLMNLFPVAPLCPSVALDHAIWELGVMPEWSGHGEVRPWDVGAEFVLPAQQSARANVPRRARMRRFQAASGYITALLRARR